MTTDNTNEAAKIAGTLSANQIRILTALTSEWKDIPSGLIDSWKDHDDLYELEHTLKLIDAHCFPFEAIILPLGLAVLSAHVSAKAEEQVTEITAREFGEQKYLRKINLQECEVFDENGNRVVSMSTEEEFKDVYAVVLYSPKAGTWMEEHSADTKFTVQWLDTQSLEGQPPAESEKPVIPEFLASMTLEARQEFVKAYNGNPHPPPATAASSEADDSSKRSEVEILIRANKRFDAIRLVHNKYDESIDDSRAYVNRVGAELSLQQTVDVSKMTLDTLQADLTALRAQLQASEDTVRGLRSLCGRAVAFESMSVPFSKILGFTESLQQAAKAGDEWATKQPASATADGSGADDGAIQARALDHVSTQWVQLHQLISEALGLEFLPNEDIERYSEAITALRDQNAALRELAARAAVAIEKSAHVHVDAWNMLDDLRRAAKGEG